MFKFKNDPHHSMKFFRDIFLFFNIASSTLVIILAILTYAIHVISPYIFAAFLLIEIINYAAIFIFKFQILDILVLLESILNKQDQAPDSIQFRKQLQRNKKESRMNFLVERIEQTINSEYTSQLLRTQAEIHALQSQINPHFLYNTLETIRSQAIIRDVPEIAEMTEALATFFRYGISSQGEMSNLAKELENAENYLLIQQYRFAGRYHVKKYIDESDEALMKSQIPILTLQPIIENAIHHGLESKTEPGTISIRAYATRHYVYIIVSDDGIGIAGDVLDRLKQRLNFPGDFQFESDKESKRSGVGIALINVNQRIKHFFGPEFGLSVTSTPGVGTSVEIILPNTQAGDTGGEVSDEERTAAR